MRNIESRSDFFRPKFSVKNVKTTKDMIIAMNTRVEKKIRLDLYSQRKSADVKELANEMKGYSEMYYFLFSGWSEHTYYSHRRLSKPSHW